MKRSAWKFNLRVEMRMRWSRGAAHRTTGFILSKIVMEINMLETKSRFQILGRVGQNFWGIYIIYPRSTPRFSALSRVKRSVCHLTDIPHNFSCNKLTKVQAKQEEHFPKSEDNTKNHVNNTLIITATITGA